MSISRKHKEQLGLGVYWLVAIIFFGALSYFSWYFGRQINYNWSYKDMVQETICETVKHEHLVDPKVCK